MEGVEEYGYVKDGKVFRNGFSSFEDRVIGDVVDTEEAAIEYFKKRFSLVEEKLESLEEKISEANNKGSFLGQLLHLKNSLSEHDSIGDFDTALKRLTKLESELQGTITSNRAKNLEIKTALLASLKELASSKEWKSASHLVKELQTKWTKVGAVANEHKEEIEGTYQVLIQGFYDNRAAFYSDLDKMMKERDGNYQEFIQRAEGMRAITDLEKLRTEIRTQKEEWKGLGRIQQAERDKHWESFQKIIQESLDAAKKANKKVQKTDKSQNLKDRKAFIAKLLALTGDVNAGFDVDKLKLEWASLGSVSKKDIEALRPEYSRCMMILSEIKFLDGLARKKSKKGSKPEELRRLKAKLIRDLLERDKRELRTFNENLGNFSTAKGLDKIIGDKLGLQERKVEAKQFILEQLRNNK